MKPLILEMNAFGPFAGRQVVDFSELAGENIFLITGPTGAGKTTVFDAVCFALYGDTSGESRQNDSLKSQFADIKEKCYVSLSFISKGKTYKIIRYPKQQKLGRNGEERVYNSSVELQMPDGGVITAAVLANKEIENIIGLTKEQFKKVVMLPQGEFRKLLEDKSDTKQEILRKIFSTDIFDRLTEQLKEKSKRALDAQSKISADNKALLKGLRLNTQNELDKRIASLTEAQIPDTEALIPALKEKTEEEKKRVSEVRKSADALLLSLDSIDLKYSEQINKKFASLKEQSARLLSLNGRSEAVVGKKRTLENLKLCEKYFEIRGRKEKISGEISKLEREAAQNKKRQKDAAEELAKLQARCEAIPQLEAKAEQLVRDKTIVLKRIEETNQLEEIKQQVLNINEKIFKAQERAVFFDECIKLCESRRAAEKIAEASELLNAILVQAGVINRAYNDFSFAEKSCFDGYERFYKSAAAHLAERLEDGKPCIVCGSTEHPAPCREDGKNAVTRIQLEKLENAREEARETLREAERKCKTLTAEYNMLSGGDLNADDAISDLQIIKKALAENKSAYENLCRGISKKEKLLSESEFYTDEISDEAYLNANREKSIKEEASLKGLRDGMLSRIEESAETENSARKLNDESEAISIEQERIKKEIEGIRGSKARLDLESSRVSEAIVRIDGFIAKMNGELVKTQRELENFVAENNISEKDVGELYGKISLIDKLEAEISEYNEQVKICSALCDSLKKELEGKHEVDILKQKSRYESLKSEYEAENKRYTELFSSYKQNERVYTELKKNTERFGQAEAKARKTAYLAMLAKGDNEQKISFERYVLTAYFEQVVEAANIRLSQLTNQRYTLLRKLEKEKNGRGSGLELSVFDIYTGRVRDVTTLSGGESFKAALSLALGLSDTISQYAGGVEADAVFIDEGFGSLDGESLDSAVSCLMELQNNGRLVGIISHVEALKERIGAKLCVSASKNGSTAQFEVV